MDFTKPPETAEEARALIAAQRRDIAQKRAELAREAEALRAMGDNADFAVILGARAAAFADRIRAAADAHQMTGERVAALLEELLDETAARLDAEAAA